MLVRQRVKPPAFGVRRRLDERMGSGTDPSAADNAHPLRGDEAYSYPAVEAC
jgi:hypothetical protein